MPREIENCELTPTAAQSVSPTSTSLVCTLSKRSCSEYDDTTEASNKKLSIDGILGVRYYDRQGIIRSNDVSITTDLPHCLDVLLSFQRFTIGDGANAPCLSPGELVCLNAKPYPEMDACNGACHLVHKTNRLPEDERLFMSSSVPSDTRSLKVPLIVHGGMGSISGNSHRLFKLNVLEEFVPLTSEAGKSFVDAWMDVVTCTFIFHNFHT